MISFEMQPSFYCKAGVSRRDESLARASFTNLSFLCEITAWNIALFITVIASFTGLLAELVTLIFSLV